MRPLKAESKSFTILTRDVSRRRPRPPRIAQGAGVPKPGRSTARMVTSGEPKTAVESAIPAVEILSADYPPKLPCFGVSLPLYEGLDSLTLAGAGQ